MQYLAPGPGSLKQMTPVDLWCHFPQDDLSFHANRLIHPGINAGGWEEQVLKPPTWGASRKWCGQPAFSLCCGHACPKPIPCTADLEQEAPTFFHQQGALLYLAALFNYPFINKERVKDSNRAWRQPETLSRFINLRSLITFLHFIWQSWCKTVILQ